MKNQLFDPFDFSKAALSSSLWRLVVPKHGNEWKSRKTMIWNHQAPQAGAEEVENTKKMIWLHQNLENKVEREVEWIEQVDHSSSHSTLFSRFL